MSNSSNELEIPWPPEQWLPETPQGQSFKAQPHTDITPHGMKEDAGFNQTDKTRAKVAQTMNSETLLCPIIDFLRDYGPVDVESDEIEACKEFLLEKGLLLEYQDRYRWKEFTKDPSAMNGGEVKIFNHIKPIVDAILEYAGTTERGRGNDYNFAMVPNNNTHSDIAGANHKMDASLVERDYTGGMIAVRFSIAPNEYKDKRTRSNQKTVREQTVGDCQHIMCEDPRRMFIFAISIEDTRMSVWYFSRSHSMKALSFDWVEEDIDTFIHVFLAFAFATAKELGLDPLVHKAPVNSAAKLGTEEAAQHYIYECPLAADPHADDPALRVPRSKYFQTVNALNDQRPYCISGRTTRIWKVIEVDSVDQANPIGTDHVVLKDVWLDHDRATEAENMDSIFNAIENLISDSKETWGDDWMTRLMAEDKRFTSFDEATKAQLQRLLSDGNYKTLFLTKLYAWKGEVSKPLSRTALKSPPGVDIFPQANIEGKPGVESRMASTKAASLLNSGKPVEGLEDGEEEPAVKLTRHYASKQQSRFVYKEVCSQLFEVGNLGSFMEVILQATEALLILFCAGWVHRDISSGNLLAFDDNGSWKLKLSDLEFSEQLSHARHRADPRTGTPFFMPLEIITRDHFIKWIRFQIKPDMGLAKQLNLLGDKTSPLYRRFSTFKVIPDGDRITAVPDTATSKIPKSSDTVRYNFQHDLEAVWWIVLYFITACVPYQRSRDRAKTLFSKSLNVTGRRLQCMLHSFPPQVGEHLHPTISGAFNLPMEMLRMYMVEQYIAREVFGQIDVHESYSLIHNDFSITLRELLENEDDDWKQIAIVPSRALTGVISPVIGTKRGRDDSDGDNDSDAPLENLKKKAKNDTA